MPSASRPRRKSSCALGMSFLRLLAKVIPAGIVLIVVLELSLFGHLPFLGVPASSESTTHQGGVVPEHLKPQPRRVMEQDSVMRAQPLSSGDQNVSSPTLRTLPLAPASSSKESKQASTTIQAVRAEGRACFDWKTEADCKTHRDGRDMPDFGGYKIRDEPCVWCCGQGCLGGGSNLCEPRDWVLHQEEWIEQAISIHDHQCNNEFAQAVDQETEPTQLDLEHDLETDPRTKLQVPRFWKPPPELQSRDALDAYVHELNGHPSIFLMIASYRDFQCRETITSALERARHPARVVVGAVEQYKPGDVPCDQPMDGDCSSNPSQPLCRHRSRIRVYKMDAGLAEGPVYARHLGDRMYRGEAYRLQVDAHVQFINDWDTKLISQFKATKNEYAILSTYLTDLQGSIDSKGNSLRRTRPIMCVTGFEGGSGSRYLRHGAQPEEVPQIKGTPMLHPLWAAGMAFSRGHVAYRVPYDCCAPQVFQGEEISMAVRAWTHGYDLYAPEKSVFFHEYASKSPRRKKVHFFTEAGGHHRESGSLKRLTAIIGLNPKVKASGDYDHSFEDLYTVGNERPVELYYKMLGIDVVNQRIGQDICPFVKSGRMHRILTAHLRPNGKGIDYSGELANFEIRKADHFVNKLRSRAQDARNVR